MGFWRAKFESAIFGVRLKKSDIYRSIFFIIIVVTTNPPHHTLVEHQKPLSQDLISLPSRLTLFAMKFSSAAILGIFLHAPSFTMATPSELRAELLSLIGKSPSSHLDNKIINEFSQLRMKVPIHAL